MNEIYILLHPLTRECRYIGKTRVGVKARVRKHVQDARREPGSRRVHSWVASLLHDGLRPEVIVVEVVGEEWEDAEQFWIAYFRAIGANLANIAPGGGGESRKSNSAEALQRASEKKRRLFRDQPERRALAARYARDAWLDPDFVRRRQEIGQKMSSSKEFKAKQSDIKREMWRDPVYAANVHAARAAADLSGSARRMWERPEYQEAQRLARERRYGVKKS